MDEDQEQPEEGGPREPKLLVAEIIFGHLIYGVADILSLLEFGVPVVEIIITPVSIWYLKRRGLGGVNTVIRYLVAKVIPGVNYLPIFTISWVVVWWIDQHPELEAKVDIVGELAQKTGPTAAGAAGAVEGETEAAGGIAAKTAAQRGPALEEEGGKMVEAGGAGAGREVTEQEFGISKELEQPLEAVKEELLEEPAVDEFAARRRREGMEEAPARQPETRAGEEGEPDWAMEKRMQTGLAALKETEESLSELPFGEEPDAAANKEEDSETINLRKAA